MSLGLFPKDENIKILSCKDDSCYRLGKGMPFIAGQNITHRDELIKNRKLAKAGLILIGLGFLFQLTAVIIQLRIVT